MRWDEGFPEDQVVRLEKFKIAHPEWHFIRPSEPRALLTGQTGWRAVGPGGDTVQERELRDLLDELERITGD